MARAPSVLALALLSLGLTAEGSTAPPYSPLYPSELRALDARLAECWTQPADGTDWTIWRVRLDLAPDGTAEAVTILHPAPVPATRPHRHQAEAIRRALSAGCAPYPVDPNRHRAWRSLLVVIPPTGAPHVMDPRRVQARP